MTFFFLYLPNFYKFMKVSLFLYFFLNLQEVNSESSKEIQTEILDDFIENEYLLEYTESIIPVMDSFKKSPTKENSQELSKQTYILYKMNSKFYLFTSNDKIYFILKFLFNSQEFITSLKMSPPRNKHLIYMILDKYEKTGMFDMNFREIKNLSTLLFETYECDLPDFDFYLEKLISKLINDDFNTKYFVLLYCKKCEFTAYYQKSFKFISTKVSGNSRNLKKCLKLINFLENDIKIDKRLCNHFGSLDMKPTAVLGNFMIIKWEKDGNNKKINPKSQIPVKIKILKRKYKLRSFIKIYEDDGYEIYCNRDNNWYLNGCYKIKVEKALKVGNDVVRIFGIYD